MRLGGTWRARPMADPEFETLIALVKEGDQSATTRLVERFGPEVEILVRRKLPAQLRRQFDTMDFYQVVWKSVLFNCRERSEPFHGPGHLRAFLAGVVHNKVTEEYRKRTCTQKYDLSVEKPLYVRKGDQEVPREIPSDDPTPSEYIQADDRMDQLVAGRSESEARIISLRSEGFTIDQIAHRMGMHEKSVRRVIEAIRLRMEERRWQ
jgi:RNA polymerase sigma factor (sigma-70 family)